MPSPSKSLHRRHLFLIAALFVTLTVAGWADDSAAATAPATTAPDSAPAAPTSPAAEPQVVPPGTPGAAPAPSSQQQPGVDLPDDGNLKKMTPGAAATPEKSSANDKPVELAVIKPITPNVDRDSAIEQEVGGLLEHNHYLQTPINTEMSQRWLKNYFDALDYNHLFFLQSDIDEFTAKYGTKLGDLLHGDNENAAVAPAFDIFNRYMQRVQENVKLSEKLLHENFDFTKDETFTLRNNKSPWLADAAASEATWRGQVKSDLLNGLLEKKPPQETIKRLSKRYASLLQEGSEEEDLDVLSIYLSALTHAYDPHSDYFSPTEAANFNIQDIKHIVTGIGAVLRSDDGYATIEEIIAGGPADLDKRLQPGDRILAVGQGNSEPVDAVNMKLDHVVDMIRGPKGSNVHLVILPAGSSEGTVHKDIILKRDMVSIKDSLAKAHIIEHPLPGGGTEKFGVINLQDFYEKTASDVAKLVQRLKKEQVAGIILDLRSNGGGLLDQAVDLTGLFVEHEPVVQIRRFDNYTEQLASDDTRQIYDGPLLVMVNKMSASATEITAAALQDYGRAIIVGDQSTHGKGTVQTLIPLDPQMPIGFPTDPGAGSLKMTVQKFYRVAGGSTQKKGVVPDIVLPSVLDALDLGETTLPYYLPYDEVPKVSYDNLNLTAPYLPALRAKSLARVAASPDFGYVRQDIAYYKKKVHDNTVSLNEATRLKEQADLKALNAQRKKDLEARKSSRDTMLDLTLDMVAQNLPPAPPVVKPPKVDPSDTPEDPDDTPGLNAAVNHLTDDPQLDEAVNIMSDYTQMLHDSGSKLVQASPVTKP